MSNRQNLDGQWLLWHFPPGAGEAAGAQAEAYQPKDWIPATVPGDVHVDMARAGLIEDATFGCNAAGLYWMDHDEWWYRRTFTVPAGADWDSAELHFDGLDTTAAIWLNGTPVGQHDNFFSAYTCDVSQVLREGENLVVVRLNCGLLAAQGKPYDKYEDYVRSAYPENLPRPWIRKPAYTFMMDWCQRLLTCGIWQGVELRLHRSLVIRDAYLVSRIDHGRAVVKVHVEAESFAAKPKQAYLFGCLTGDRAHSAQLIATLVPGVNKITLAIPVENPRLWWPNGSGEPYLYDFTLEISNAEAVQDRYTCRYGIREVELIQEPRPDGTQSFIFAINGQRVFARGANWIPADCFPATMNRERYHALVAEAAGANFNLLRVWGGGLYEKDSFYDCCDEQGIMLWQDFTYSLAHYPDDDAEFLAESRREVTAVVRRLRNHPSLIMWCGNNEIQQVYFGLELWGQDIYHRVLPEVCGSLDPSRPFWPGSPYGGENPQDPRLGDTHNWVYLNSTEDSFRAYAKGEESFVSEWGALAPSNRESLAHFLAPEDRQPGTAGWNFHNNYCEGGKMAVGLKRYFGLEAAGLPLEDYTLYAQLLQAEALKYGIEHYRRRKYGCGGALFWSYNDCWGTTTGWGIIDYYLSRRPSYYYVRRAFNPVLVSFKEEPRGGLTLWGTNDTRAAITGELVYGLSTISGEELAAHRLSVIIPADSSLELAGCPWPADDASRLVGCYYWVRLSVGGQVLSENRCFYTPFEHLAMRQVAVAQSLEPAGGGAYRLWLSADAYAWVVRIIAPPGVAVSDDCFDLRPGERKAVIVRGQADAVAAIKAVATGKPMNPELWGRLTIIRNTNGAVQIQHSCPRVAIRYTVDGTEPDDSSVQYDAPCALNSGGTVKAYAFLVGGVARSRTQTAVFGVDRTDWKVVRVSLESPFDNGGMAGSHHLLNDDPATYWHTYHTDKTKSAPPHEAVMDMGRTINVAGFTFMRRMDPTAEGAPDRYEFHLSTDGTKWTLAAQGEWSDMATDPAMRFVPLPKPVSGRFMRFVAKHVVADNNYVVVAGLGVVEAG